ncbi:polyribonucleotide nucleotidyltransferase [Candidatus Saccharibacteria bacterium]|nr:polyribonucleotide nucleotidyltransferase [Candidatus Saccharibacteria bacterium]MCB9821200.1 polyribonucleotide nucleotidyltransferase [Candidatus Nomurabacteria bacterium]
MDIINPKGDKTLRVSTEFCGRELSLEVNRLAFRSEAAVLVTYGDTVVLGNVNVGDPISGMDYFPLTIDYEERFYAAGKISGSRYIKREGKPSDDAVLIGRLIDRPIRPLFPKGYRNQVQAVATVLSLDPEVRPDAVAMIAISTAMTLTGVPFDGPVAGVRVGLVDGKLVAYPNTSDIKTSDLDIMVACVKDGVMMVEAGANEVSEATIVEAMEVALKAVQPVLELQTKLAKDLKVQAQEYELLLPDADIDEAVTDFLKGKLGDKVQGGYFERKASLDELRQQMVDKFSADLGEDAWGAVKGQYLDAFELIVNKDVREQIITKGVRPDGRELTQVRPLSSQVGVLPRTHGSAIFTRGVTQALNITTLAPLSYTQAVDTMEKDEERRYFHHYNAPAYTLGETGRMGSPGRREIGHGYLAERAVSPMLPSEEDFPYAIRTVTEIMSQHGSTSMAATCSSVLSLMDAGVPLKRPVSGVAMGLIMDGKKPVVLTDIQDAEDFAGDMDFKVTGTTEGVTALQMDMKVHGLPVDVLAKAIEQAKQGRADILAHMLSVIKAPRAELSQYAPRVETIKINPDKIRDVIGKGGETIQRIIAETGADIDIKDDGTVFLASNDGEMMAKVKQMIADLTEEPEVGKIYRQRPVVKVMDFGAFVNLFPGTDGMVHVSEMAEERVESPSDVVKEGDLVDVKLMAIDDRGRLNLSMKKAKG